MKLRQFALNTINATIVVAGIQTASAAVYSLPQMFVPSTAYPVGPSFILETDLSPTDTIQAVISGTVNFDADNDHNYSADWNAAGIVVRTFGTTLVAGGSDTFATDLGWLRLTIGNDSIGYFPLFDISAENGLGSASPPETLLLSRTASSIFTTPGFSGLTAGTTLSYRIVDNFNIDNTGGFNIVPEPHSGLALLLGLITLAQCRRRS